MFGCCCCAGTVAAEDGDWRVRGAEISRLDVGYPDMILEFWVVPLFCCVVVDV